MNQKPTLLLIDDEERILRSLAMLFRGNYILHTTTDPQQALDIVEREPVHVIVSDQRMPIMRGAELLRRVKEKSPNTMRLLLTGYSELEAVVASVNEGEIFRFINKPWDAAELRSTVQQAAEISRSLMSAGPVAPPQPLFTDTGSFVAPAFVQPEETLLVIDDDAEVMKAVQEIVGPSMSVLWARTLDQAMEALERHEISLIVSELVVNRESVTPLLKLLKAQHPEVVTIVLTPFQDVTVFIGLINQGQVFRLLPKPVRRGPLGMSIGSALRHHRALRAAPKLRAAYQVEKIREPEEASTTVATRVLGLLSRIRGRAATT
ncbi:MAG TPA: response regulator [Solimonas sp.]|nr:response regulator [Solimonas sp.]